MSRSYKKHPVCKDGNRSKKASKKLANRRVRNSILSGGMQEPGQSVSKQSMVREVQAGRLTD